MHEVGLKGGDLAILPRGDPRKALIADALKSATVVPLDRIAERASGIGEPLRGEGGSRSAAQGRISLAQPGQDSRNMKHLTPFAFLFAPRATASKSPQGSAASLARRKSARVRSLSSPDSSLRTPRAHCVAACTRFGLSTRLGRSIRFSS